MQLFFVCAFFSSRSFSSVHFLFLYFVILAFFRSYIFSSVHIFIHADFRLCHFESTQFSSSPFFAPVFFVFTIFRLCILSFVHLFSTTKFFMSMNVAIATFMSTYSYTCWGLRLIVREVSAIRGGSCVAAERRSDPARDRVTVAGQQRGGRRLAGPAGVTCHGVAWRGPGVSSGVGF